jgi:hypothetical protein
VSARIVGNRGTFRLRFWHDASPSAEGELVDLRGDLAHATAFARSLAAGIGAVSSVRKLLGPELAGAQHLEDEEVVRLLATALAAGRILAVRLPAPVLPTFDVHTSEPEQSEPEVARAEPKTWIEIELVDTEGKPVPNERYWILLPDGTVREGRLSAAGRAYFGDLDPGECDVRFPDLDNDAVAAPGEPAKPKARQLPPKKPRKTWVEIELLGMDGSAIPGELYRITLPDGTAVEGRLNERGRARVSGIDPGACTVTFPELDLEAWEPA